MNVFNGMPIIIDDEAMSYAELDFSNCRSPGRAKRRWKQRGIVGHSRVIRKPRMDVFNFHGKLIMHSMVARELQRQISIREGR